MKGTARNKLAAILAMVLGLTLSATPARAQDLVDLSCGPDVTGPSAPDYTHTVTATAAYTCGTVRPSVGVSACLLYNGAPVDCDVDTQTNSKSASVDLSFPCFPGVWAVAAVGSAVGGPPGGTGSAVVQLNCDPLDP